MALELTPEQAARWQKRLRASENLAAGQIKRYQRERRPRQKRRSDLNVE